jgi:hypothetical protein
MLAPTPNKFVFPGHSEAAGPDIAVTRLPEVSGAGQVRRRRHPGRHQVCLGAPLPYFPGPFLMMM